MCSKLIKLSGIPRNAPSRLLRSASAPVRLTRSIMSDVGAGEVSPLYEPLPLPWSYRSIPGANGGRVFFWESVEPNPQNSIPLILVHGGVGSANHWVKNLPALAPYFKTYAIDMPGFGNSTPPAVEDKPEGYFDGILRLIEHLKVPKVNICAFSFGASITTFMAAQHSDKINKLLLLGPGAFGLKKGEHIPGEEQASKDMVNMRDPWQRFVFIQRQLNFKNPLVADAEYFIHAGYNFNSISVNKKNILLINRYSYLPEPLSKVSRDIPLLMAWGDSDQYTFPTLAKQRDANVAAAPQATVKIIPNAGHMAQWEQSHHFNMLAISHFNK